MIRYSSMISLKNYIADVADRESQNNSKVPSEEKPMQIDYFCIKGR